MVSGLDRIPEVVLKICELNIYVWKSPFFQIVRKSHRWTLAIQIFYLDKKMLMQNRLFSNFISKMVVCTLKKKCQYNAGFFQSIRTSKMVIYLGKILTCLGNGNWPASPPSNRQPSNFFYPLRHWRNLISPPGRQKSMIIPILLIGHN